MAKLKLNPDPTFPGKVDIHVPGSAPATVVFTFKHRTREELKTFMTKANGKVIDAELVMQMASGWDLEDEFTKKNVDQLIQSYIAAPNAIYDAYVDELSGARTKN